MTVSTTTSKISYTGNGATTLFAFPYPFLAASDLQVYVAGVLKTLTTDYTVSGTAPYPSGANVTFVSAPANGASVVINRVVPYTQTLDLVENDPLPAEAVEQRLDANVMMVQQLLEQIGRAIVIPVTDVAGLSQTLPAAAARANQAIIFDSVGNVGIGLVATATVSPAMQPVVAAATLAAARTALGLGSIATQSSINLTDLATQAANTFLANATSGAAAPTAVALAASQLAGRGSSGNIAAIALGTNLSMSGGTLNGANGLVFLGSATASSSATVSLTSLMSSTYDDYVVEIDNLNPASTSSLMMKLSNNNGSTYQTNNNTNSIVNDGAATTYLRDSDAAQMTLTAADIYTNSTGYGPCSAQVLLRNVNTQTTAQWSARWSTSNNTAAVTPPKTSTGGGTPSRGGTNVINAVQFLMSTGNIGTGTFRLYGVQKS